MKIEYLIKKIEDMLNDADINTSDFSFKLYDSLKMDNEKMDVGKINGIARVMGGSFDPIKDLGQGEITLLVEFIYPYERLDAVKGVCEAVSKASAGLVIDNATLSPELVGTTGIAISYPIQGNYANGTMGETAKSKLICYFDINEKAVLSNEINIEVVKNFTAKPAITHGTYYKKKFELPEGYRTLDYIEFDGLQTRIDIGSCIDYDIQYKTFDFQLTNNEIGTLYRVLSNYHDEFVCNIKDIEENKLYQPLYVDYLGELGALGTALYERITPDTQRHKLEIQTGKIWLDNERVSYNYEAQMLDGPYVPKGAEISKIFLFESFKGKIYKIELAKSLTEITFDLYPCIEEETNKVGLYDTINNRFYECQATAGTESGTFEEVTLPADYEADTKYYSLEGGEYVFITPVYYEGKYYVLDKTYKVVTLPADYAVGVTYYDAEMENIPYYKYVITRHRLSTTNKYENNKEMQTVNDGQSIDFSLAVPSVRGSVFNGIKDDMLTGDNIGKAYYFRFKDESGYKYFNNMIASGDFSYEVVPGDTLIFKILFVYKRG